MLPRAALRATRISPSFSARSHNPKLATARLKRETRTYASGRPSAWPPAQPVKPKSQHSSLPSATGASRQTSPGTNYPKDKTWKPQDGIKFGGPTATTATGAGKGLGSESVAQEKSAETMVDGSRPADPAVQDSGISLEGGAASSQPLAQQADADAPEPGSLRDHAQEMQAASENTPAPSEESVGHDAASKAQQPLPDLRYGIPSTLDFELNKTAGRASAAEGEQAQGESFDLTSATGGNQGGREREQRENSRAAYETSLDRRWARRVRYFYASIPLIIFAGALYMARPFDEEEQASSGLAAEDNRGWTPSKLYSRMRARLGNQVGYYTEPSFAKLLPEVPESQRPPYTLVLSLEDLLIHSDWDRQHGYRTAKRPGIDYFIRYLSQYYELVLFSSVPMHILDPIMKKLDPYHFIMWPLSREATKYEGGEYVKDLSYLNRPLKKTLVIDTHAPHLRNQPENAIIVPKWQGDPKDPHTKDLVALIPFLEYVATMGIDDVRTVLKSFEGKSIPEEFARREAEARAKFNAQLAQEKRGRSGFSVGSLASGLGMKGSAAQGGGMILADGQSVAEGLAQGKMLSDQIREQGQRQYEALEKQIRENGAKWLKEEEEEQKKMMEASVRDMKKSTTDLFGGWFGGSK